MYSTGLVSNSGYLGAFRPNNVPSHIKRRSVQLCNTLQVLTYMNGSIISHTARTTKT